MFLYIGDQLGATVKGRYKRHWITGETERGLSLAHTTIYRWVQRYAPELDKCSRPYLKQTNDSWRVDETFVKVRNKWL